MPSGKLLSATQLAPMLRIRNRCMAQCLINLPSRLRDSGIGETASYDQPTFVPYIAVAHLVTPDYRRSFWDNHIRSCVLVQGELRATDSFAILTLYRNMFHPTSDPRV